MRIVIIGNGKLGYAIARKLAADGHSIVVVDRNEKHLSATLNDIDVSGILGSGVDRSVLEEAGVPDAQVLIAATQSDETNIIVSILANKLGAAHTIARVREPEYARTADMLRPEMGPGINVNPELEAAEEISRIFRFPSALRIDFFSHGRVEIIEMAVGEKSPLDGLRLSDFSSVVKAKVLVCTVHRGDRVFIPGGDFVLQAGDRISITGALRDVNLFFKRVGYTNKKVKNVMIVGGGQLSYYLAKMLLKSHTEVTIIERDMARCEELVEALPGATIDCGDGTEEELLREEHLESMDGFVACTGMDEVNAILSLYALKHSSKKVITKVNHVDFGDVIEGLQLDSIVNPKQLTAQQIVQYVRAAGNSMESNVETLYRLMNGRVEALEFLLDSKSSLIGTKLADMRIKKNVLIAGIVREGKLIIPGGQDAFQAGDTVIVVTTNLGFHEIENILA